MGSLEDHRISKLQPFNFDPLITDPVSIADKDKQMFVVESILEMRGDPNIGKIVQIVTIRGLHGNHILIFITTKS